MKKLVVVLAMLALNVQAKAGDMTGNQFLAIYENQPMQAARYLEGLIDGMVTLHAVKTNNPTDKTLRFGDVCAPANATMGQFLAVAVKHLKDDPKNLHMNASVLLYFAFEQAWPCKK